MLLRSFNDLHVDGYEEGEWWICYPDGDKFQGPYKRAQDAKAQLTKYKNLNKEENGN